MQAKTISWLLLICLSCFGYQACTESEAQRNLRDARTAVLVARPVLDKACASSATPVEFASRCVELTASLDGVQAAIDAAQAILAAKDAAPTEVTAATDALLTAYNRLKQAVKAFEARE